MTTLPTTIQTGRVTTEGDSLYYEVRGQGPALLLIAAAGGDADYYAPIADILTDEYKVVTFDRRANSRSTIHTWTSPKHLLPCCVTSCTAPQLKSNLFNHSI